MEASKFYKLSAKDINGDSLDFSELKGKKIMIVNTASECGLTPQYEQLQELHENYGGDKFMIIGFPSNDFGAQEPGAEKEIETFCSVNYGVTFKMMSKVSVKGDSIHDVYKWLTQKEENTVSDYEVTWNFHKFLIDEEGNLVRDVAPDVLPINESILTWISK